MSATGGSMAKSNVSRVIEQLRRERERISRRMERIEVSLAAFGIIRFKRRETYPTNTRTGYGHRRAQSEPQQDRRRHAANKAVTWPKTDRSSATGIGRSK